MTEFIKVHIEGSRWGLWHAIAGADPDTIHTACGLKLARARRFATSTRPVGGQCMNCRSRPTSKRRIPRGPARRGMRCR